MATDVILPALGMAQDSGTIVQWLKGEGDKVERGEPVAEIQTDKVTVEIEAPASGTLISISARAGDEVPVGQVIARILAPGEPQALESGRAITPSPVPPAAGELPRDLPSTGHVAGSWGGTATGQPVTHGAENGRRLASPKAKRLAAEYGVDLVALAGSRSGGIILAADVLAATTAPGNTGGTDGIEGPSGTLGRAWQLMAERTAQSWGSVPHFYLEREVTADALISWRDRVQKQSSDKLTYTDLLIRIVAKALRLHPRLNCAWMNGTIVNNRSVNVGIAVAVPDGLVVPVISHADELTLEAIAARRADVVERAQRGKLRPEDLEGGTFTISNLGMYGVDAFSAIINAPQAAILAVGALSPRVVPVGGLPAVVPTMMLTLSCDHRVVDGARGAEFLSTIAGLVADPPQG